MQGKKTINLNPERVQCIFNASVSQIDKKNEMYADILMDIHKKFLVTHPHSFVSANLLSTIKA